MKKVIALFLVILISTVSVFAQKEKRGGRNGDLAQRSEKMVEALKLNEQQAAEFRKVNAEFKEKMMKEREAVNADREKMRAKAQEMRKEKDAQIKKILTDEQFQQYLEKQKEQFQRKGKGRK